MRLMVTENASARNRRETLPSSCGEPMKTRGRREPPKQPCCVQKSKLLNLEVISIGINEEQ